MPPIHKRCPGCNTELPPDAFRKDSTKADKLDSYCKGCRREQTKANRPRENARWNSFRKAKGATWTRAKTARDPRKIKARYVARKVHEKPRKCIIRRCPNRGVRHHYLGYDPAHHADIIWLCPKHHALEHLLERARSRTGPTYYTTKHNQVVKGKYRPGARVRVKSVHIVEELNPEVNKYVGQAGTVELVLPAEWDFQPQYRVLFDDPAFAPLAFFARELEGAK